MGSSTISPPDALRQRQAALQRANKVRRRRRDLREQIGGLDPPDGASLAARVLLSPPGYARTMTVSRLLTAVHGFGTPRAKEIAGARSLNRMLDTLSTRERKRIAAECRHRAAHLKRTTRTARPNRAQAMHAIDGANATRFARARALHEIAEAPDRATGAFRAAGLLSKSARATKLNGLSVQRILEAIPGIESVRARELLEPLSIADSTTLEMLSRSRAVSVASALVDRYGHGNERLPASVESEAVSEQQRIAAA